jgi:transposase
VIQQHDYGYLNRIQSSRRLERETQRNLELIWLTGRLMPDFKTIADFRRDNGPAIRAACAQFAGRRASNQRRRALRPAGQYRPIPKPLGLFDVRAEAQMHTG